MEQRSNAFWVPLGLLLGLLFFSLYLAMNRIYQVDEAQNIYMARIIGTGQTSSFFTNAPLWLLGPLAGMARSAQHSAELFGWARLTFLAVFWTNIFLLTLCTGVKVFSTRGLTVCLMAATLAPLWDYGFEVRHDNLILMGLLLMWWLGRTRPRGLVSYTLMGFLAVLLEFVAFKAFVYVLPLAAVFLLFPPPGHGQTRLRLALGWLAGALSAFLLCRLVYGLSGLWPACLAGFRCLAEASVDGTRFGPWMALQRLLAQTPLLLGVTWAAFWHWGRQHRLGSKSVWRWGNPTPECLLVLGSLGVLCVNPTPFPYNLVNVVPFAFLLAQRYLEPFTERLAEHQYGLALASGLLLFTHAVPFSVATWRHVEWNNDRQVQLMNMAEALTDPGKDRVYDAIGMVPTRSSIHFRWFLHSLNINSFVNGKSLRVQDMLQENPPAVFIPSYRTDWLPPQEWAFIRSRYIPLADDFWVLGQVLPSGGGVCEIVHSGRYLVLGQKRGRIGPLEGGRLDEEGVGTTPIELSLGSHHLSCPMDTRPIYIWIGPHLDRLPELGSGDHQRLFVNWY